MSVSSVSQIALDLSDPATIVSHLSPFIVLAVTWVMTTFVTPNLSGTVTLLIVMALGTLSTFITQQMGDPDMTWIASFGYNLAATFIHQFNQQLNGSKDKKKLKK